MQVQRASAVRRAPAAMATAGAELARLLRLLTAVLLLGAALLVVALVGQGVAGARELPLDGTSRPHGPPLPVAPATPAGASFVQQWSAARDLLGEPTAAVPGTARSGIPPGGPPRGPGTTPPPEWWLALRTEPPAPEDPPAEHANGDDGDDQRSLHDVVLAAGPAAAGRAAQAAGGAEPSRAGGRAVELQQRAAEIETTIRGLKQRLHALRAELVEDPEAVDGLLGQMKGLAAEHREIRRTVPYPPELDAWTPSQLKLQAELLRGRLWANRLVTDGRLWLRAADPAAVQRTIELDKDRLQGWYSDVAGAVWARLQAVRDERDRLSQPGTSGEERQQRASRADEEAMLQGAYDQIEREGSYPPYLEFSSLEEIYGRAAFLRAAIEANQRRLAGFDGLLSAETSPLPSAIEKQSREYQKELGELDSYLRRHRHARPPAEETPPGDRPAPIQEDPSLPPPKPPLGPPPKPPLGPPPKPPLGPPPKPPPRPRTPGSRATRFAESESPEPSAALDTSPAPGGDANGAAQAWVPTADVDRPGEVGTDVLAASSEEPAEGVLHPDLAADAAFDAASLDPGPDPVGTIP
jgi:hypothetical protein